METAAVAAEVPEKEKKKGIRRVDSMLPCLTVAPRNAAEAFLAGSDAGTPSPWSFVPNLFSNQDPAGDYESFWQRLSVAIASPAALGMPGHIGLPSPDSCQGSSLDMAWFNSTMSPGLAAICFSPYLTISPGISPGILLQSPVLLSAGLNAILAGGNAPGSTFEQDDSPKFLFNPYPQLPDSPLAIMGPYGLSHQQALAQVQAQANSQLVSTSAEADASAREDTLKMPSGTTSESNDQSLSSQSVSLCESMIQGSVECSEKVSALSESMVPACLSPDLIEQPFDDGYNWRKYGQKAVKFSEYPRSYYKCTHPNCPMKKTVELSDEGHITKVVYKRHHNHTKPEASCKNAISNAHTEVSNREGSVVPTLDRVSSFDGLSEIDKNKSQCWGGLAGIKRPSPASTNYNKVESRDDDKSAPKCVKLKKGREQGPDPPLRTIQEPRIVVQTTSDIALLDDGYRWKKYGQKVVRGNPRSYYRCTNVGCTVKKQVERFPTDPNSVMTSYEGKHNHDVPPVRNAKRKTHVSAAAVVPACPQPRGNGSGISKESRAISLQEQIFGNFSEVANIEPNNTLPEAFTNIPSSSG